MFLIDKGRAKIKLPSRRIALGGMGSGFGSCGYRGLLQFPGLIHVIQFSC